MSNTPQRKKRTGLTVEKVFSKEKYRNILLLISANQSKHVEESGTRRAQLIDALVLHKNGQSKSDLSLMDKTYIASMKKLYKNGKLDEELYKFGMNWYGKGLTKRLMEHGDISSDNQFHSIFGLRNALIRLQKLELITTKKPKKGYPVYILTDKAIPPLVRSEITDKIQSIDCYKDLDKIDEYINSLTKKKTKEEQVKYCLNCRHNQIKK